MTPAPPCLKIPLLKKGDTKIGSASFWNQIIKTVNAIRTLRVESGESNSFKIAGENAILSIKSSGDNSAGTSGWHWAATKEYDSDFQYYDTNEVVVVSPSNPDVSLGNATAGLFVCLKPGTWADAGLTIHYPIWPPPNDSPDSTSNYWWLIALYPTVLTVCVGGINTDYFINAQPVPVA